MTVPTDEHLPIVTPDGQVLGQTTRHAAHSGKDGRPLHPVVHLHVYNPQGELYLQHRPAWKDIQPDRWDTAVGGHVEWGETIAAALVREVHEEIGLLLSDADVAMYETNPPNLDITPEGSDIHITEQPQFVARYVFESPRERELVHIFRLTTVLLPHPSEELDGGAFFTDADIRARLNTGFFTPNFEHEWSTYLAGHIQQAAKEEA